MIRRCKAATFFVVALGSLLLLWAAPVAAQKADVGYLKTHVNPGRAGVFVDGKYLGPAANFGISRKYALAPGEHEVKLMEPRYQEYSTTLKIEAGKTTNLAQTLQAVPLAKPPFGRLRIKTNDTDKFAAVYVNGKFMGHVDEFSNFAQGLLLNPGEYAVKIVPSAGGADHEETVKIQENQITMIHWDKK